MKNSSNPKRKRRRPTWTFQPDDDVRALVESRFGPNLTRGQKTALINEAIRIKHAEAAVSLAEQDLAVAKAKLEALKDRAAGTNSQSA